jgi:hypothetical protein
MALFAAGDAVKSCAVFFFAAFLGAMASCTTEAASGYAPAVLGRVVILVALKALSNITVTVKEFAVVEFAVYKETYINQIVCLVGLSYTQV